MNNSEKFMVEKIRTQYMEESHSDLDELRALDVKVRRPAEILAYTLGCICAVIMGSGMSLVMTDLGATLGIANAMIPGIIVGVIGLIGAGLNYLLYVKHLARRKARYAPEILALSEKLLKDGE